MPNQPLTKTGAAGRANGLRVAWTTPKPCRKKVKTDQYVRALCPGGLTRLLSLGEGERERDRDVGSEDFFQREAGAMDL